MKKNLTKILAFVLTLTMIVSLMVVPASGASSAGNLGKLLDSYAESNDATYTLNKEKSRIFVVSDSAPTGNLLQTVQLIHSQFAVEGYVAADALVWGPESYAKTGDIVLQLDTSAGIADEGYKMEVAATAKITASDVDGLLYGANTLMKCFAYGTTLQGFTATNAPDTKERTVSLDCGRKYLTAEWIKNFIRQMSWMGYNTLQLHFSDDGGFRIDLWDPQYFTSANGNDFSWLAGSKVQYWVYNGNKTNSNYDYQTDADAGKCLTAEELVDICNVAKEYHIEIIPSFDSPAHMDYITWKFEYQYNFGGDFSFKYNKKTYNAGSTGGCINYTGTTGNPKNGQGPNWYYAGVDITEGTMAEAFVLALYTDIADFFKKYAGSTKFSVGADEVGQGTDVKWTYAEDFPVYINKLNSLLNSKGYTMRMYNDFIGTTAYSTSQAFASNIEIMYWDSPFNPNGGTGTSTQPASYFVEQGRTLYNCIQTHTYYVLRVANTSKATTKYTDARNPANRQWTFYHSTEDLIYDEWAPNNVREVGVNVESDKIIPNANLGGAYFLIWNDYASVSTESELWNGAPDRTGTNNGATYYLLDRMASNITKMWNWDVNDTVSYNSFAAVRDKYTDYFPGYTSCSAAASLPAAAEIIQAMAADQSALNDALKNKISNDGDTYTPASYAAYEAAYAAAEALLGDPDATQDEVNAALNALLAAENALQEKADKSTLQLNYNGTKSLMEIDYTPDSWAALQTVLAEVKRVLDDADATQKEVDNANTALNDAKKKLVLAKQEGGETPDEPEVSFELENLGKTAVKGKKVGLRIVTAADASAPVVKNSAGTVIETDCWSAEQTIDGEKVIVWLVEFDAPSVSGNYTVTIGEEVAALPITVG